MELLRAKNLIKLYFKINKTAAENNWLLQEAFGDRAMSQSRTFSRTSILSKDKHLSKMIIALDDWGWVQQQNKQKSALGYPCRLWTNDLRSLRYYRIDIRKHSTFFMLMQKLSWEYWMVTRRRNTSYFAGSWKIKYISWKKRKLFPGKGLTTHFPSRSKINTRKVAMTRE